MSESSSDGTSRTHDSASKTEPVSPAIDRLVTATHRPGASDVKRSTNRALMSGGHVEEERRLTLEDCIDMDVDILSTVLERSFQSLKRETLDFFMDARTRFKTRAMSELNHERSAAERRENKRIEEMHLLETELGDEKKRNDRLLEGMSRMAEAVGAANLRKRSYRSLLVIYQSWTDFAKFERGLRRKQEKAVQYYSTRTLTRKPFVQWLEHIREQTRSNARQKLHTKLSAARNELENEFKTKLVVMENECEKLKEKLKAENELRSKLEEDMQQAFMRGVCALNMEALSVMNRGMPPSGHNPFIDQASPIETPNHNHQTPRR